MTDNGNSNNNNNNNYNNEVSRRLKQQPEEQQTEKSLHLNLQKQQQQQQQPQPKNGESHPYPALTQSESHQVKKKRRDKSDLGDDFVPPDGGWGWLVAVASGINILVTFALAQQFGILFRERMENLGISNPQMTTIINTQIAVSAFTGLLNGPLFRRYTYRAVALVGSLLTFLGLFWMVFAESFAIYILSFSLMYGFGRGLTVSASSLAVNTYFKVKRRTATAYQFGVAGLGPIVCPFLATFLIYEFGVVGTTLLFAGASLHTIACSLIYQPVKWHVAKRPKDVEMLQQKSSSDLQSKDAAANGDYGDDGDDDDDDDIIPHVVEPETPVLPRANDGWFGSRASLNSSGTRNRLNTWDKTENGHVELKRLNSRDSAGARQQRSISISHSIKEEPHDSESEEPLKLATEPVLTLKEQKELEDEIERQRRKKLPFYMKIVIFFDLDLLKDFTYVNLAFGITLINFVEINFAILTPFILHDLGFDKSQTALAMGTLGFFDLVIRFMIPLISTKIILSNRTFFVVGILGMCVGRVFLSMTTNFYALMAIFLWLGLNKAFRTVFWSLIIPGYVPLKRLPAAAGLQLLMSGIFSMAFGPVIGLVRDNSSYSVTLNCLNALCVLAIAGWYLEDCIRGRNRKAPAPTGPTTTKEAAPTHK
ncbi:monocarboxylate transporter 7 [Drosophila tropicalis]|uniref:monocarboxylate transporter 7 n=1 Tax=Drosophila tropicalis TaxID=46794 RepID=UPI0035AB9BF9